MAPAVRYVHVVLLYDCAPTVPGTRKVKQTALWGSNVLGHDTDFRVSSALAGIQKSQKTSSGARNCFPLDLDSPVWTVKPNELITVTLKTKT